MPIQGSLQDMSVLEAVQLVGTQRKSTTLVLESKQDEVHLHFREGLLVSSHRKGGGQGEPFLDAMVALGHLSPSEAMSISQQIVDHGRDLWRVALEMEHLTRETCEQVYRQATEATLDRVLLWEEGHFALLPTAQIEYVFDPGISVDSLLLDAMRRIDELASWKQGQLAPEVVPCLEGLEENYVSSDPIRRAVLRQVDGRRTLAEIVEATRLGEYEIYSAISEGAEAGWVQLLRPTQPREMTAPPVPVVLRRVPAMMILVGFLAVAVVSIWFGQTGKRETRGWSESRAQWEELDLRRQIEVHRFRHGSYPANLDVLEPFSGQKPASWTLRWRYKSDDRAYTLTQKTPRRPS
jgi:hypothetical protein